jgi:hypothetical protein
MKTLSRVSLALIAVPLLAVLYTSFDMILFVQPERKAIAAGTLQYMFSYENYVHEGGFARLTLAMIGLLILFFPYRGGERWAFAALFILLFAYEIPVFFFGSIPTLGMWPIFRNWPNPRASSLAMMSFYSYFFTALWLVGLALAVPRLLREKTP